MYPGMSSSMTSSLIGGQNAMFQNYAAFSQQIAGTYGTGPQMMAGQSAQNPFPMPMPTYGMAGWGQQSDNPAKMAGAAALSIPGITAGVSIAGGIMGGAAGWLDPFTGVGRSVLAGSGALGQAWNAGQGFSGGMAGVGRAMAGAGVRGSMGMMAGGLAAGAMTGGLYYAAGKAIDTVGQNLYQGVQNIQDVQNMSNQYMTPQYGQAGAGVGGSVGRGTVKQITSFLHEMASEDVMTSMADMRKLMDQAGRSGMLTGAMDANSFKQKFRQIIDATKNIAQVLGTSLEEAMPMMGQMRQMGMWTSKDVMGTAALGGSMGGQAAGQMMGVMQSGAQLSHAMGGKMKHGAALGRSLFSDVNTMMRSGLLSEEELMDYTGGVGGEQGQAMMAGNLQQSMAGFGKSPMGGLMMAGLGEMKGGAFTGEMDKKKMDKFLRGELSVGDLSKMGRQSTRTKEGAVSFHNRSAEMGQSMAAQGGMAGIGMAIQKILEHAGYAGASDEIQNRFIQQTMQVGTRDADAFQKLGKNAEQIASDKARSVDAYMQEAMRRLDTRRNRSMQGLKDAIGKSFEEGVERPLQELAEGITTSMGDSYDDAMNKFTGRVASSTTSSKHMAQLVGNKSASPVTSGSSLQKFINPGQFANAMITSRQRGFFSANGGLDTLTGIRFGRGDEKIGGQDFTGSEALNMAPRARILIAGGLQASRGIAGAGEVDLGGGLKSGVAEASRAIEQMSLRASGMASVDTSTPEKKAAMGVLQGRLRNLFNSRDTGKELSRLKKESPENYASALMEMAKADGVTGAALDTLSGGDVQNQLNAMQQATIGIGASGGTHDIDFRAGSEMSTFSASSQADLDQLQAGNIEKLMSGLKTKSTLGGQAVGAGMKALGAVFKGTMVGAVASLPIAILKKAGLDVEGTVTAGITKLLGVGGPEELSRKEWEQAIGSDDYSQTDIAEYIRTGKGANAFAAASEKDGVAKKLREQIDNATEGMSTEEKEEYIRTLGDTAGVQEAGARFSTMDRMKSASAAQGRIDKISGVSKGTTDKLEGIRAKMADMTTLGQLASGQQDISEMAMGLTDEKEINALLGGRGGAVGKAVGTEAFIEKELSGKDSMTTEEFDKFRKKMKGKLGGRDLTTGMSQDKLNKMLEGGLQGSEMGDMKNLLKEVSKANQAAGAGGGKDSQERLLELLSSYTKTNTLFVDAVGAAVPALKDDKLRAQLLENKNDLDAVGRK